MPDAPAHSRQRQRGIALLLVAGLVALTSLVAFSFLHVGMLTTASARTAVDNAAADLAASSGLEFAAVKKRGQVSFIILSLQRRRAIKCEAWKCRSFLEMRLPWWRISKGGSMDMRTLKGLRHELATYTREFRKCIRDRRTREHMGTYMRGQLGPRAAKSAEPIALDAGVAPRTSQQFLSMRKWDEQKLRRRHQRVLQRDHGGENAIVVVDETTFARRGDKTVGVKRQYCGTLGKVDNCVASSRCHIEQLFEEARQEVGFDAFEVHMYRSVQRHLALSMLSVYFLSEQTRRLREEKSLVECLSDPQGDPVPVGSDDSRVGADAAVAESLAQDRLLAEAS